MSNKPKSVEEINIPHLLLEFVLPLTSLIIGV